MMFGMVPYVRKNQVANRNDAWNMDRWFDEFFAEPFFSGDRRLSNRIRTDVKETDNEYILEAEMPGIAKEDIKLELKDDFLTIGVEKKEETNDDREGYIYRERSYGNMTRRFHVQNVAQDRVKAAYENGILRITMPKAVPMENTKQITIE